MKIEKINNILFIPATIIILSFLLSCNNKPDPLSNNSEPPPVTNEEDSISAENDSIYDVDVRGIPKFVTYSYINIDSVNKISRFRSGIGHDYSDDVETCRSMKHYFFPSSAVDWSKLEITAPVSGSIVKAEKEQSFGTQYWINSEHYPAFNFIIFHVVSDLKAGDKVTAGQFIGYHVGSQTTSDIAINVNTPQGFKLISFFDIMTDSLFNEYKINGVTSRDNYIIKKTERDGSPLTCNGETFTDQGVIENWVIIHPQL